MKKIILLNNLLILLLSSVSFGQTTEPSLNGSSIVGTSGESVVLFTDRDLYCSGEDIYFTSDYSCIGELDSFSWSNVLYIELITWEGAKLAQMKIKLNKPGISGSIRIPEDILSGNYYLRAYTKWMRNFSVYDYAYVPVKIVNPFLSEIEKGPESPSAVNEDDSCRLFQPSRAGDIICSTNKVIYKPREKAEANLSLSNQMENNSGRYCISIVRAGTINSSLKFRKVDAPNTSEKNHETRFLPEIYNISISGKVIDQVTGRPVKLLPVSLSDPQFGAYFSVYRTNEKGEFFFTLPDMKGKRDFFIQAENADSLPIKIMIDDEYCINPVRLPYIKFAINQDEDSVVHDMVINKQLSDKYSFGMNLQADSIPEKTDTIPFYGSNVNVYMTDVYIELPNIEEFIFEIVYEAIIKNTRGVTTIVNKGRTAFSNYPLLILIDNVHVINYAQLLKIPLNKINRVEAIDKGYVVGNMNYNGLISIYSRNGDFAGIDLTQNSRFFNYDLFSKSNVAYTQNTSAYDSRIPDRRNLVYWNPDIQINANAKTTISFDIPDTKGQYVIFIRSKNDPDVFGSYYFTVD